MVFDAHLGFQLAMGMYDRKDEAFAGMSSDSATFISDQEALYTAGVLQSEDPAYEVGAVVPLTHAQFHAMEEFPSGLVYHVDCPDSGNGPTTNLTFSGSTGKMNRAVLISDCNLHFSDGSEITGSTIVTIRESANATLTSDSSVTIGSPVSMPCEASNTTTIMTVSKMTVPAEFATSNVTIIAGDDVLISSGTSTSATSNGISIYSQGEIQVAAQHTFNACNMDNNIIEPDLDTLRLVLPVMPAQVAMASP
jgi:hypothetical protein